MPEPPEYRKDQAYAEAFRESHNSFDLYIRRLLADPTAAQITSAKAESRKRERAWETYIAATSSACATSPSSRKEDFEEEAPILLDRGMWDCALVFSFSQLFMQDATTAEEARPDGFHTKVTRVTRSGASKFVGFVIFTHL